MGNSGSSPLAGKAITVMAAGVAALGLGAWSFASSSSSPSIDSYAQKKQQMSAATATTQQIYLQQDPEPISNCYGFIQDTVEVREGVDPAPTLNIQRQHIKSKEITRSKLPVSISNFGILPDDVSLKHVRVSAA